MAAAFAAELVRIGNLTGTSATESTARGRRIEELTRQLASQDEETRLMNKELERVAAGLEETHHKLARAEDQLRWHRIWLDGMRRSAIWSLTAQLTGKRGRVKLEAARRRLRSR